MKRTTEKGVVKELQGLYGPVQILEARIQQMWGLQEWRSGPWSSESGERIRVLHAGYVNRGVGPDFREARIEIGGQVRIGDVEVHLYREDWWRHGHDQDPRYEAVVLHAVLFPGGSERPVRTRSGRAVEEWIMGQWLPRDLESIAGGEVGLWGETAPELREWAECIIPGEALEVLKHGARRRWEAKLSMAAGLLEAHGWEGALHRMVLYYLGYPINRLPFWEMADTFPPELWGDSLIPFLKERWWHHVQWSAGRPGARAEARLLSYARLPHGWMDALLGLMQRHFAASKHVSGQAEPPDAGTILEVRRRLGLGIFQAHLIQFVLGAAFAPDMAQRLLLDVFVPLCAASGVTSPALGYLIWFNARPGHYPTGHAALLQTIGLCDGRSRPIANGLLQGLYRVDDDLRLERLRADQACTAIDVGG